MAKMCFKSIYGNPRFETNAAKGVDLRVLVNNEVFEYEIKGTADPKIAFSKLKVSS